MINNYKSKIIKYIEKYKNNSISTEELGNKISKLGYRIISRNFLHIGRIDRSDWREKLDNPYCDANHYRRCYSNDQLELKSLGITSEILKYIKNSNGQEIGFVSIEKKLLSNEYRSIYGYLVDNIERKAWFGHIKGNENNIGNDFYLYSGQTIEINLEKQKFISLGSDIKFTYGSGSLSNKELNRLKDLIYNKKNIFEICKKIDRNINSLENLLRNELGININLYIYDYLNENKFKKIFNNNLNFLSKIFNNNLSQEMFSFKNLEDLLNNISTYNKIKKDEEFIIKNIRVYKLISKKYIVSFTNGKISYSVNKKGQLIMSKVPLNKNNNVLNNDLKPFKFKKGKWILTSEKEVIEVDISKGSAVGYIETYGEPGQEFSLYKKDTIVTYPKPKIKLEFNKV